MDKFAVYHSIKSIQSIVSLYPAAESVSQDLAKLAQQLSSRIYRVAVIGEFKRGKSSLVNCILGTEILPTDILPTTAVVNRIVYGTEQKIEIHYKDGTVQNTSVEELAEYATKKNESNASQIREIVVHYPSVFCQNNIQLLDTPGLNDDEFMDKTTLDVLDKIDTAIVATHASYPISETEKNLICRLIEQDDIYHLTFVATFIDRVSDEPDEQDRIVELIRNRLSGETYQLFCQKHQNEPKLLKKAARILCNPVVFAVSSRLAMQGFVNGNKKMLDESRFPHFKYELAALLTANQELDLQMKAARLIHIANENYASWHGQLLTKLDENLTQARNNLRESQNCQKTGCAGLVDQLVALDREIERSGIFVNGNTAFENSDFFHQVTWTVMRHLLQVSPETVQVAYIRKALDDASAEMIHTERRTVAHLIHDCMKKVNEYLIASEKKCGLSEQRLTKRLAEWSASTHFPQMDSSVFAFSKTFDHYAVEEHIRKGDCAELAKWVQEIVSRRMYGAYCAMQDQIRAYITSWRSQILRQNEADKEELGNVVSLCAQQVRSIRQQYDTVTVNYNANQAVLKQAEAEFSSI